MVVPIFAPIMKGAAFRKETIFLATMGTTSDVVIVLDRIAAVVPSPHKKDLKSFRKKKRLKRSVELTSNNLEINFRKRIIDEKSKAKESTTSTKPFRFSTRKSITGVNPSQKCEILFSTGPTVGVKKYEEMFPASDDKKL